MHGVPTLVCLNMSRFGAKIVLHLERRLEQTVCAGLLQHLHLCRASLVWCALASAKIISHWALQPSRLSTQIIRAKTQIRLIVRGPMVLKLSLLVLMLVWF